MIMATSEPRKATLPTFSRVGRRPINLSGDRLVKMELLDEERTHPLVVEPLVPGVSLDGWVASHRDLVEQGLLQHGSLLFRGFGVSEQEDFERFIPALGLAPMQYMEGATPRKTLGEHVYTSTEFPAEHPIALHNELSYVLTWPMKVLFFCVVPPGTGGETPIGDVRRVYDRISPSVLRAFAEKGW